jgi:hypothetical protein
VISVSEVRSTCWTRRQITVLTLSLMPTDVAIAEAIIFRNRAKSYLMVLARAHIEFRAGLISDF